MEKNWIDPYLTDGRLMSSLGKVTNLRNDNKIYILRIRYFTHETKQDAMKKSVKILKGKLRQFTY